MKSSILLALLLLSSSCFATNVKVFKILDGTAVTCTGVSEQRIQPEKAVSVSLVQQVATDKMLAVTVKVSAVICKNGSWNLDLSPALREYVAPNGKTVKVSYDDYELLLVNENYEIVQKRRLGDLSEEQKGTQTFEVPYVRGSAQNYDLFIRVHKTVLSESYQYNEIMNFGGFRLHAD